jgi:hypothetical protein
VRYDFFIQESKEAVDERQRLHVPDRLIDRGAVADVGEKYGSPDAIVVDVSPPPT